MSKRNNPVFTVRPADWNIDQQQLRNVRHRVFIEEQHVPVELEWDGLDEEALHLLAFDLQGHAIGCARVLEDGSIGRMAVLAEWRKRGVGKALLQTAIDVCRACGHRTISLSAQTHAIAFYERAGFVVCSEEYPDAGIPHRDMRLELST